jgi:hypothetical protein
MSMHNAAGSRQLGKMLKEYYALARPQLIITKKDMLTTVFGMAGEPIASWFDELWGEAEKNEAHLSLEYVNGDEETSEKKIFIVGRFIRTAAARITRHRKFTGERDQDQDKKVTAEVLIEFIVSADRQTKKLRRFNNSISGKIDWDEKRPERALWREFVEELGVKISLRAFRKLLRKVQEDGRNPISYWKDRSAFSQVEIDVHKSTRYPTSQLEIRTHNQVYHYVISNLPQRYWKKIYLEELRDGKILVHIWAPADIKYNEPWLHAYIDQYMQRLIFEKNPVL